MKKFFWLILVVVMCFGLFGCSEDDNKGEEPKDSSAESSTTITPETTPVEPTPTEPAIQTAEDLGALKDRYADNFKIGVALPNSVYENPGLLESVKEQFNSVTFENEMKPDHLLDANGCRSGYPDTNTKPVVKFSSAIKGLEFAKKNGFGVRGHVLVWFSQTPAWFFTKDYKAGSELASKEVMIARMQSYIEQVMTYCQENYPGLIYAWDVVNEALNADEGNDPNGLRTVENLWYETVGPEYVTYAFRFARQYVEEGVDLYYNDYNCAMKISDIVDLLTPLYKAGLCDGIGMQCHLTTDDNIANAVYYTASSFAAIGLKVQITELDIGQASTENADETQAIKYKVLFERMEEAAESGVVSIDSITIWGLYDAISWRKMTSPLLFTKSGTELVPKRAWFGAMQADDILAIEW